MSLSTSSLCPTPWQPPTGPVPTLDPFLYANPTPKYNFNPFPSSSTPNPQPQVHLRTHRQPHSPPQLPHSVLVPLSPQFQPQPQTQPPPLFLTPTPPLHWVLILTPPTSTFHFTHSPSLQTHTHLYLLPSLSSHRNHSTHISSPIPPPTPDVILNTFPIPLHRFQPNPTLTLNTLIPAPIFVPILTSIQIPNPAPIPTFMQPHPTLSLHPLPHPHPRPNSQLPPTLPWVALAESSDALHILASGYFSPCSLGTGRALQGGEKGVTGAPAFWKRMGRNSAGQEIVSLPGRKWRGVEVSGVTLGHWGPSLCLHSKASQSHDPLPRGGGGLNSSGCQTTPQLSPPPKRPTSGLATLPPCPSLHLPLVPGGLHPCPAPSALPRPLAPFPDPHALFLPSPFNSPDRLVPRYPRPCFDPLPHALTLSLFLSPFSPTSSDSPSNPLTKLTSSI